MVSVNMREMLEAGVHFGHQVRKWNPKMKPYIYGKRNGIYIINLQTSIELFKEALNFVSEVVASGKETLIVGTKKQAQSIITDISEETGMHYVNKRWLGGLLTNFAMIKKSIEKLIDLDEMKKDGRWEVKSKKEQSRLEKIYKKLYKNLWGIRNIKELPGVLIVIDSNFEEIAVYEARKLNIPIVGIVDTNANPEGISYPVPGNDDAIRSIKLFTSKFGEAVKLGLEKRLANAISKEEQGEIEKESADFVESEETSMTEESPAEEAVAVEEKAEVEEKEAVEEIAVVEEKAEVKEITEEVTIPEEEETLAVAEEEYSEAEDAPPSHEEIEKTDKVEEKKENIEEVK